MIRHLRILRATPVVVFAFVAFGSVAILVVDHRRVVGALESSVATVDNLTQARLHATEALLAVEQVRAGDRTLEMSRPIAELDQAIAILNDLRRGRGSLVGMAPRTQSSRIDTATAAYLDELVALRGDLVVESAPSDVERRMRSSSVAEAAWNLEHAVYDDLRDQLAAEDARHRLRVVVWILFLMGSGSAFFAARRGRDRSEAALHAAEGRYAALATHAAAGLLRTDRDGRVMEFTDGWDGPRFSVGQPWWAALPKSEAVRAAELWTIRRGRLQTFFLEVRYERPNGASRWLGSRWVYDSASSHDDGSWIGTVMDETEHRLVEDQLRQAQRLESVGRLVSGVAHDFNNFLAVILSSVEALKLDPDVGPGGRKLAAEIEAATEAGRELVAGLTGFSRKASLDLQPIDLGKVVGGSAQLARRLLSEGCDLKVHVPDDAPVVHADRRALQQILLNLVSNARDAMPEGGTVRLEVDGIDVDEAYRDAHPWVELGTFGRITVTDTGTGMDRATLARVFDPFFTTKEEGAGTGLGMATVHGLVRQHGGHIHAYSEPGLGTTFRIYLPRAGEPAARTSGTTDPVDRRPQRPKRILLVDDDEVLRRTATRLLVRLGHQVLGAPNGRAALEILEAEGEFDVIISDVSMDEMGGLELFQILRERGQEGRFVFTSGHSVQELTARGTLPEGTTYLAKPWTVQEINRALEKTG